MRWIAILSLVIPPILSLISYLYYSIPSYAEDIAFEAVWDNIKIERDQNGIPNIQASSLEDAFFGLGYVHAQDRLFQLDILRRTAEGSLAEILGEDALDIDIFAKNIGFSHHASLSYSDLSNKSKILLKRYTDGINSYAAVNNLPFEFFLTWNH